jgi:pantoate--beta-alanine ligase
MLTITDIVEMKDAVERFRRQGRSIGFVPTMGFLHEGHLSLVRESLFRTEATVVSIFVNPSQFGPGEDFKLYPRDFERDAAILKELETDVLFAPQDEQMYPEGFRTYVQVEKIQDKLLGKSRPGHFKGVCTVVLKLFNIIRPDWAFFGQKDAQQAVILKKMVDDLNVDIRLEILPIVREKDGLALSSRNLYLNPEERKAARILSVSLKEAQEWIAKGETEAAAVIDIITQKILTEPLARIDYVEVVDGASLEPLKRINHLALIDLGVYIGKTRLIDNVIVRLKE